MKAVMIVVLTMGVAMAGGAASARPFDRRKGIDFVKLAEKAAEAKLRHQAALRGVNRRQSRPVAPRATTVVPNPWARPQSRPSHLGHTVLRRVWIPGRYEQVVQYVPVRGRHGRHGVPHCDGVQPTRPVVVKRWIAGHYEWQRIPAHHPSFRRQDCGRGSHRGGTGRGSHR